MKKIRYCILLLTIIKSTILSAQLGLRTFADIGYSHINQLYSDIAFIPSYTYKGFKNEGGIRYALVNNHEHRPYSFMFSTTKNFKLKTFPLSAQVFYHYNSFSDLLNENNWGVSLEHNSTHFRIKLGNNFRSYRFNKNARENLGFDRSDDTRIDEPWNMIYAFTYSLKTEDNPWNISTTLTDLDYFMFQQETNPMIYFRYSYRISSGLKLFSELWYKSAGLMNIRVNYYGTFFRLGMIWEIN